MTRLNEIMRHRMDLYQVFKVKHMIMHVVDDRV